jgi:hypothetical protein
MLSIHRLKLKNLPMIAQLITWSLQWLAGGVEEAGGRAGSGGAGQGTGGGAGGRDYSSTV